LYFSDEVAIALKDYLQDRLSNENVDKNENALFLSLQNKRIGVRAVEQLVKKYAKNCVPLKHITPHKLRSTYGTNLYRATGDIYIVADVLGHRDVNTTKKHYAAISEDARRNVANILKLRDKED
jgi:integrase/recombinase XerC